MAGGRPTDYTPELGEYICNVIAGSPKSTIELCKTDDKFPPEGTFYRWLLANPKFHEEYLVAKEIQGIAYAERIMHEIDNCPAVSEEIQLKTLKFRNIQWHVSKLAPKQFGDKKEIKQEMNINVHEDKLKELE